MEGTALGCHFEWSEKSCASSKKISRPRLPALGGLIWHWSFDIRLAFDIRSLTLKTSCFLEAFSYQLNPVEKTDQNVRGASSLGCAPASCLLTKSIHPKSIECHFSGGPTWPRTRDLPVMSRWLFQLSYGPDHFSYFFKLLIETKFVKQNPSYRSSAPVAPTGRRAGSK